MSQQHSNPDTSMLKFLQRQVCMDRIPMICLFEPPSPPRRPAPWASAHITNGSSTIPPFIMPPPGRQILITARPTISMKLVAWHPASPYLRQTRSIFRRRQCLPPASPVPPWFLTWCTSNTLSNANQAHNDHNPNAVRPPHIHVPVTSGQ